MLYSSGLGSTPASSPSSSLPSTPRCIQVEFTPAGSSRGIDIYPSPPTNSSQNPVCAYSSSSFNKSNSRRPSAYISDEDLFGNDDDDAPYLREAPLPPRPAQAWIIPQPLLPPLPQSRRRSSGHKEKKRRTSSSASSKK